MSLIDPLSRTLLFVFLITSMLGIGLSVSWGAILAGLRKKGLMIRSLLLNFVIVPLLGLLFIRLFPMRPEVALAFLFLACAPGGLSAIQFTSKDQEGLAYAGTLAAGLTFLSIFISPLLISLFLPSGMSLAVPYARAFWFVLVFLILPLVVGILLHGKLESLALKLAKPFSLIGTVCFIAVIVLTMSARKEAQAAAGSQTQGVMLLFIIIVMLIGWFMGGPKKGNREVLATASSMRNIALCMAIVLTSFPDRGVEAPLIAFVALMIPVNMVFTVGGSIIDKIRAKRQKGN